MNQKNFLKVYGLDWEIQKVPLKVSTKKGKQLSSYFNLIRTDNGHVLGSCSSLRRIKQNPEILEEVNSASEGLTLIYARPFGSDGKHILFNTFDALQLAAIKPLNVVNSPVLNHISIFYHHDTGKYEVQNSYRFIKENGVEIKANIAVPYSTDLSEMIKKAQSDYIDTMHFLHAISDLNYNDLFIKEISNFLINPNNEKWTKNKIQNKIQLIKTIRKEEFGQTLLSLFVSVAEFANQSMLVKDKYSSVYLGKSKELIIRCFNYIKAETDQFF